MGNTYMSPRENYFLAINKSVKAYIDNKDWPNVVETLQMLVQLDNQDMFEIVEKLHHSLHSSTTPAIETVPVAKTLAIDETPTLSVDNSAKPSFNNGSDVAQIMKTETTDVSGVSYAVMSKTIMELAKSGNKYHYSEFAETIDTVHGHLFNSYDLENMAAPGKTPNPRWKNRLSGILGSLAEKEKLISTTRANYQIHPKYIAKLEQDELINATIGYK
jgi:hypothetical protein